MDFLKGKKTIIVAVLFGVAFLVPKLFKFDIPEAVLLILGALGLGAFRLALQALKGVNRGWRTYAAAVITFVAGLAQALGWAWFPVEIVIEVSIVLGIVGVRGALKKLE